MGKIPISEIMSEGLRIQKKKLKDECGTCQEPLILEIYRYKGKKLRHIVVCKTCNHASRLK